MRRRAEELSGVALVMPCADPLRELTLRLAHDVLQAIAAWERLEFGRDEHPEASR